MAKLLNVSTSQVSYDELKRIIERCGFIIFHGKRHDKIKTQDGKFIGLLARHNKVNRNIARSIVGKMNEHGANITFT